MTGSVGANVASRDVQGSLRGYKCLWLDWGGAGAWNGANLSMHLGIFLPSPYTRITIEDKNDCIPLQQKYIHAKILNESFYVIMP